MRALLLLVPALALSACSGPTCQSSCEKLFGDDPGECDIQIPNTDPEDMLVECLAHCDDAMARNGDVGTYDPNQRSVGAEVSLLNEKQAALWMDCVDQTACDLLKEGSCAPTQNFP
jgi:hypothetical protein